jgi:glutamate synthase domain-containing protein 1
MNGIPVKQGLYDPRFEHDGCGVGFVADIKGRKSNAIIRQGLEVLKRLAHRGATGADPKTGDGAGVLLQLPHKFFCRVAEKSGISLPREGAYASGLVFLPKDATERDYCKGLFLAKAAGAGMRLLGWRAVPVDSSVIGETARSSQPVIEQVFVAAAKAGGRDNLGFEQELFLLRKEVENALRKPGLMYIANLSCRSFSYKGLLMPQQLDKFFLIA